MKQIELIAKNISKKFNSKKYVFKGIDFAITNNQIVAVTGHNGAGKSTLLRILASVWNCSDGNVKLLVENEEIEKENYYKYFSFISPYLNLYEEFTPIEHLVIFAKIRGINFNLTESEENLKRFKLYTFRNSFIKTFSSGMKQRMKFVLAMQNKSELLFLDEPTSNLDNEGFDTVSNLIIESKKNGCAVIIATNDDKEKQLADSIVALEALNRNI